MTQSMLEKVARAIEEVVSRQEFTSYEDAARAAVEAMRNLDGRSLALILHDIDELRGQVRESNATYRIFWDAAISHALNEGGDQ